MFTREYLKGLELDSDMINKIMSQYGKAVEKYDGDAQALQTELDSTKALLATANTEIEGYKSMNIDEVKKAAEDWETKFKDAEQTYKNELEQTQKDYKISLALKETKTKDESVLLGLIDKSVIKFDKDGNIKGLAEQITTLKNEKSYLFEEEADDGKEDNKGDGKKPAPVVVTKVDSGAQHGDKGQGSVDVAKFMNEAIRSSK